MESGAAPKVFISYSWDDDEHKDWVRSLATRLRSDGVDVTLDQWHLRLGDELPHFMERAIRENDFVLIICTPKYKRKSEGRSGGVGYEGDIIQGEVFTRGNHRKFIPILKGANWDESAPIQLLGKFYINLGDIEQSETRYRHLLNALYGEINEAPHLGVRPTVRRSNRSWSEVQAFREHKNSVEYMAISDDGSKVASVSQGILTFTERRLLLWQVGLTKYLILEPENRDHAYIKGLAMSGDGNKVVLSAYYLELLTLEEMKAYRRFLGQRDSDRAHPGASLVKLTADGKQAVLYSGGILQWDTSMYTPPSFDAYDINEKGIYSDGVSQIAMDGSGTILLLALGSQVVVYNIKGKSEMGVLRSDGQKVEFIDLSRDGFTALTYSERILRVWDVRTGKIKRTIPEQSRTIKCASISEDGNVVAVGLKSGDVEVHFLELGHIESFFCGKHDIKKIAMTPNASTILVALDDCSLRVWKSAG